MTGLALRIAEFRIEAEAEDPEALRRLLEAELAALARRLAALAAGRGELPDSVALPEIRVEGAAVSAAELQRLSDAILAAAAAALGGAR